MVKREVSLTGLDNAQEFARNLGAKLHGHEVITFASDLGGGKTTLIKSIVSGSGSSDLVSSPTFTICNTYSAPKFSIQHFDFYRLQDPGIMTRQLDEVLHDSQSVVLIEWPKTIQAILPKNTINITIDVTGEHNRKLTIDYPDEFKYLFDFKD